jgi:tRNA threonylcarbamoyladenosine biosynthesis protein TsaE
MKSILKNLKEVRKFIDNKILPIIKKRLKKEKKIFIIFSGPLGAGKTTFIKIIAKKFKIKENIKSPTFIIWQRYEFKYCSKLFYFNHLDIYRLGLKDLLKLSFKNKINEDYNIYLVEWGEKLIPYLKKHQLPFILIKITILNKKQRLVELANG